LEREREAMTNSHRIPMTTEERPVKIFAKLTERFPDVRWVGQAIHIPAVNIWVKPPWEEGALKGPEGEDLALVRRVVRETK
jgi:hypothetical protein